jgi:hypothetical protein
MGELIYGAGTRYEFDDRVLTHVKVAVGLKLRRNESFYLSWTVPVTSGSGRVSIWISSAVPLQFHFAGSRPPAVNRTWLEAIIASAHSDRGMVIIPEDAASDALNQLTGSITVPDAATPTSG